MIWYDMIWWSVGLHIQFFSKVGRWVRHTRYQVLQLATQVGHLASESNWRTPIIRVLHRMLSSMR